jgi:riboflavin biosynthesis pyrimidine reductase
MDPIEALYEVEGLPRFDLPASLTQLYGGAIGFQPPRLVANFVATIDGVVAVPSVPGSNRVIAASSVADRFVMGLLRACCDAVVIGSGTLAASPTSTWTPARAYPAAEAGYAQLRAQLGLAPIPELVVVTARGALDVHHPALAERSVVLTTDAGLALLADRLPKSAAVVSLGPGPTLAPAAILTSLGERGHRLILHEGGPHAIGPMFAAGLVDELFLTVSPLLAGRIASDPRLGLIEGFDLLGAAVTARLLGVRRGGDHLFLRYCFAGAPS